MKPLQRCSPDDYDSLDDRPLPLRARHFDTEKFFVVFCDGSHCIARFLTSTWARPISIYGWRWWLRLYWWASWFSYWRSRQISLRCRRYPWVELYSQGGGAARCKWCCYSGSAEPELSQRAQFYGCSQNLRAGTLVRRWEQPRCLACQLNCWEDRCGLWTRVAVRSSGAHKHRFESKLQISFLSAGCLVWAWWGSRDIISMYQLLVIG